jgi:uncharacterized alpha-E superfamily protein
MQRGGGSKDTWVIRKPHEPVPRIVPLPAPHVAQVMSTELSSRVADNLFWLGRYAERLEATARLVRVLLPGLAGESDLDRRLAVDTTLHYMRGLGLLPEQWSGGAVGRQWWRLQRVLTDMVFDPAPGLGIAWQMKQVRRLSWEVKERLSPDTWRVLQQLERPFDDVPPTNPERRLVTALSRLDDVVIMLSAFAGLLAENPTRGHGWRFLGMGRRMERALQMLELLRVGVAQAPFPDDPYLEVLLQVADSSTTYRSRYLASIRTRYVLELLLVDEANPRSVAFQAAALLERVRELPRPPGESAEQSEDIALAERLCQRLRLDQLDDLKRRAPDTSRPALEATITLLRRDVTELSDAITARYLVHSAAAQLRPS